LLWLWYTCFHQEIADGRTRQEGDQNHTTFRDTKKSPNLSGQKKIIQPLWTKKITQRYGTKKSPNLLHDLSLKKKKKEKKKKKKRWEEVGRGGKRLVE
jgi:hypothetical protein